MSAVGEEVSRRGDALPPHVLVIQMATAFWVSRVVYAAAKLGLADRLADGPRSAAELAGLTGTHPPSLHRLMRTLAGLGILTERDAQRFALTPLGETLRSGAPGSARATVITLAGHLGWRSWEELMYSLETGKTGFEKAFGVPAFDYLARNPEEAAQFNETMIGVHGAEPPAVAAAYDFSASAPWWTWEARPATCWRRSWPAMPGPAACSSICRMWSATRRHC